MSHRLIPPLLPAAHDPLEDVKLRGWIHEGLQPLDGLLLDIARAPDGAAWPVRLLPWLEAGAVVRQSGNLVLVLFTAARREDCAALGVLLPVRRFAGCLSTAPIAPPVPPALADHLIHVVEGRLQRVPLAAFQVIEPADWFGFGSVETLAGRETPALAPPVRLRLSSRPTLKPEDVSDAPLMAPLRVAVARRRPRSLRAVLQDMLHVSGKLSGAVGKIVWRTFQWLFWTWLALSVLGVLVNLVVGVADRSIDPVALLAVIAAIGVVATLVIAARRRPGPAAVAARAASASGAGGAAPATRGRSAWQRIGRLLRWYQWRPAPIETAPRAAAPPAALPEARRRPLWQRFAGWLAWRSPLGANLRDQYAKRILEVERLIALGRFDEALRKAIALRGGGTEQSPALFGDLPLTGPGLRRTLEVDLAKGAPTASGLSLADDVFKRTEQLYRDQVARLIQDGAIDEAVFVLVDLLNDIEGAIRLLSDHNRWEFAARIAQVRRLPPQRVATLWFRAGRRDIALALAARHDLFAVLWAETKADDPFRAVLAEAWAKRLAAAGAVLWAAVMAAGVAALAADRRAWLRRAIEEDPPPSAALARALLALDWSPEATDPVHERFQSLLAGASDVDAERRLAVATHLADETLEAGTREAAPGRNALVAHTLALALAADQGQFGHDPAREKAALALSEQHRLDSLRVDLRRLAKLPKPSAPPREGRIEIAAKPPLAPIVDVALLAGDAALIGHPSGSLRLFGQNGRERWHGQVGPVRGFATLTEGRRVFIVHEGFEGLRLSIFTAADHRLDHLGAFPVEAWHPEASETGWLVFDGSNYRMLDTLSLLDPAQEGEPSHHWSVPMSEAGRPCATILTADRAVMVHGRYDGLIEWWTLDRATLKIECRLWSTPPRHADEAMICAINAAATYGADVQSPGLLVRSVQTQPYSRDLELNLLTALKAGPQEPMVGLVPAVGSLLWATARAEGGMLWQSSIGGQRPGADVFWNGAQRLWARARADGARAAIFDEGGHLVVLDSASNRLTSLIE